MPDSTIKALENFIGYCSQKGRVIAKNIANSSTEDYKRKDVTFENILGSKIEQEMKSSRAGHVSNGSISEKANIKEIELARGVNIEEEMAELAKNSLNFKLASKKINGYYKNLQSVIKSGG